MTDKQKTEQEPEAEEMLAGKRLAEARRAQEISVLDIAKELHLDEPKVRALEENQFDVLGAPVFAKGHLRKYAELVGVPTDDILADYYSLNRAVGAPPVVGRRRKIPRDYDFGRWIARAVIVLAVVAAAAAAWWWFEQRAAEPLVETDTATLAPFVSAADEQEGAAAPADPADRLPESAQAGLVDGTDEMSEPVDSEAAVAELTSETYGDDLSDSLSEASQAIATDATVPQATLDMRFSGDCWTEVSDASGKRLFFDLGRAGRHVSVTGAAPLRALFGDSANVAVAVNGQDYVIPDSMLSGRTARLTVNAR